MFDLSGRVALVTGASRGIGRATALALAGQGAQVLVGYHQGAAEAAEVVETVTSAGGTAQAVQLDVGCMAEAERTVAAAAKRLGRLDILVANAGITADGLLPRMTEEALDRVWAVNVKGAMACARAALRPMMRARFGRIVLLSSVSAEMGNAGQAAYASSKAAIIGLGKTLAREYASRSITANVVAPGLIETDMTRDMPTRVREMALQAIPLGRPGAPEEVGAAVVYLCSEEAGYVTGQVLRVNGGMYG